MSEFFNENTSIETLKTVKILGDLATRMLRFKRYQEEQSKLPEKERDTSIPKEFPDDVLGLNKWWAKLESRMFSDALMNVHTRSEMRETK